MSPRRRRSTDPHPVFPTSPACLPACLQAELIYRSAAAWARQLAGAQLSDTGSRGRTTVPDFAHGAGPLPAEAEALRWWMQPSEAAELLLQEAALGLGLAVVCSGVRR